MKISILKLFTVMCIYTYMKLGNAFTVDVEEWFHISGIDGLLDVSQWGSYENRVVDNTTRLLDILDEYHVKGTFFVLGWIAETYPALVKEIYSRGHELGTHGFDHTPVYQMNPEEFRAVLRRSVTVLEKITGERIVKHRAPSFSINERSAWAFDVLAQEGFVYDSSVFYGRKDIGGTDSPMFFERAVFGIDTPHGPIIEYPLTVKNILFKNIPVTGGGYLRATPLPILKRLIKSVHREGLPICLYVHPSDIDPDRPVPKGASFRKRFNARVGLKGAEKKLRALLELYNFCPMGDIIKETAIISYKRLRE